MIYFLLSFFFNKNSCHWVNLTEVREVPKFWSTSLSSQQQRRLSSLSVPPDRNLLITLLIETYLLPLTNFFAFPENKFFLVVTLSQGCDITISRTHSQITFSDERNANLRLYLRSAVSAKQRIPFASWKTVFTSIISAAFKLLKGFSIRIILVQSICHAFLTGRD